jgi:hypothetical protein
VIGYPKEQKEKQQSPQRKKKHKERIALLSSLIGENESPDHHHLNKREEPDLKKKKLHTQKEDTKKRESAALAFVPKEGAAASRDGSGGKGEKQQQQLSAHQRHTHTHAHTDTNKYFNTCTLTRRQAMRLLVTSVRGLSQPQPHTEISKTELYSKAERESIVCENGTRGDCRKCARVDTQIYIYECTPTITTRGEKKKRKNRRKLM